MTFLRGAIRAAALGAIFLTTSSWAQGDYPNRSVKMVVGFSAGSITDQVARLLAEQAKHELGQTLVIDNVPGAGATIAATRVANAPADGYNLLFVAMGHAVAPALYSKLPYDTLKDFQGVATVANARVMMVTHPKARFRDLKSLISTAKANPADLTYGSSGYGTFLHLIAESFAQSVDVQLRHVPYRSGNEAVNGVLAGTLDLAFCTVSTCIENVRSGKLISLGYIAPNRNPAAPEIPTFGELGVNFDGGSYNYVLVRRDTPSAIVQKLHAVINKAVTSDVLGQQLARAGLEPVPSQSPAEVDAFVKREVDRWSPLVKKLGLKID